MISIIFYGLLHKEKFLKKPTTQAFLLTNMPLGKKFRNTFSNHSEKIIFNTVRMLAEEVPRKDSRVDW